MDRGIAAVQHPYYEEIARLFYDYRLAQLNRRYYSALLRRAKSKNLVAQVLIGVFSVSAAVLLSLTPSFPTLSSNFLRIAALLSALAFIASVVAPVFGWNQSIDSISARIHSWHYAERQLEAALRFLNHSAESKRDAELQVRFAEDAFRTADDLPDTGKQDIELTKSIRLEVEQAIPPDYVWTAL